MCLWAKFENSEQAIHFPHLSSVIKGDTALTLLKHHKTSPSEKVQNS